ncbi:MAG: NrfD/PsrC family molybdoenzyme membrane anchor subunit [Byssovorax sp.]
MPHHLEIDSTRGGLLAAGERFWDWEIPVYLFLGGLVAGLMLAACAVILAFGRERVTRAMRLGLAAAPVLLGLGMGALFLDLTLKTHVFRFYLTLRPSSPMSLGSWVLLLVFPAQALLALALPFEGLAALLDRVPRIAPLRRFAEAQLPKLAWAGLILGVALGVYTGVLLSATVAHPLWSSGALGFLFLASGTSTGVAALMLAERDHRAHGLLARADMALIALELATLVLWLVGLSTQSEIYHRAAMLVLSGPYAPAFLGVVVFGGLLVPLVLEALALRGRAIASRAVPALVIAGGLVLRFVVVFAGQELSFVTG